MHKDIGVEDALAIPRFLSLFHIKPPLLIALSFNEEYRLGKVIVA